MARVAAMVAVVVLLVAGCGASDDDAQDATTTSTPPNEAVEILRSLELPLGDIRPLDEGGTTFMPDGDGLVAHATAEAPSGSVYLRIYESEQARVEAVKARNVDNARTGEEAFFVECGPVVIWLPRDTGLLDAVAPDDLC